MPVTHAAGDHAPRGPDRSIAPRLNRRRHLPVLAAACLAAAVADVALAQSIRPAGIVSGVVRDSAGARLVGAELTVDGARARAFSNDTGGFRILGVPAGPQSIRARRLGFSPSVQEVRVDSGAVALLDLMMGRVPVELETVTVSAAARPAYTGWAADFYRRKDRGSGGRFIDREQIERRGANRVTDFVRTIPGVTIRSTPYASSTIFFRGRTCPPFVWIDGTPAMAGYLDVDAFDAQSLEGIETYSSPATVPAELSVPLHKMRCGMIVLWTKMPDRPDRKVAATKYTAGDLASLVRSLKAYTADQVDTPVRAHPEATFAPRYPAEQRAANTSGSVIVEFIVDINGKPEMDTFGVVSASQQEFVDATRTAVAGTRFLPAELDGTRVRQVVQLPVRFDANGQRDQ